MKILLISPFLPYPGVSHAGAKLVFHLLTTLAKDHSVHLVSRVFPGDEGRLSTLQGLVSGTDFILVPGPHEPGNLLSLARTVQSYRWLARKADDALRRERFDLCQVEYTEAAVFFSPPKGLPSILSLHDVIAKPAWRRYERARGAQKIPAWLSWRLRRALEGYAISKFRLVFTLSQFDRGWAERLYPSGRFRVLRYPAGLEFIGIPRKEVLGRVLFLGALNRPQNIEAVRYLVDRVWPMVYANCPNAELRIVGGGMAEGFCRGLEKIPGVNPVGWVEQAEEEYASTSVFAAPILVGGGIIVKILDALAAGVPVVTTRFGNEGIGAVPGKEILVADEAKQFAAAVVRLLRDPDYNRRIGESGRLLVRRTFGKEAVAAAVSTSYQEVLEGRKPG